MAAGAEGHAILTEITEVVIETTGSLEPVTASEKRDFADAPTVGAGSLGASNLSANMSTSNTTCPNRETEMSTRPTSLGLLGSLAPITLMLLAGLLSNNTPAAPVPPPKPPYALVFVPKQDSPDETNRSRRYQKALVGGRYVLHVALRSLKADALPTLKKQDDPVGWLSQNLKIEYLDYTSVIRITLTGGSRREQAILVNAVARAYFRVEVSQQRQSLEDSLEVLKSLRESFQKRLKVLNQNLERANVVQKANIEDHKKSCELEVTAIESGIKQREAGLRALPQLLELADVPPE
jgi:hypothetical protein